MNISHVSRALRVAMTTLGWTEAVLSRNCGLSQAGINRVLNSRRRPEPATLQALCNCWPDAHTNVGILIEHLRDEVELSGHADGTVISRASTDAGSASMEHNLELIRDSDPELYSRLALIISDIYRLLTEGRSPVKLGMVAEKRACYTIKKRQ